MAVDTKSMRAAMNAVPGDRVAMSRQHLQALIDETPGDNLPVEKSQVRALLDAVDLNRVADRLVDMSQTVRSMAIAA